MAGESAGSTAPILADAPTVALAGPRTRGGPLAWRAHRRAPSSGGGTVLQIAQDPEADALLDRDPFALLVGMLLDQQFPMERAFAGPPGCCRRGSAGPARPGRHRRRTTPRRSRDLFTGPPARAPLTRRDGRAGAGARRHASPTQYGGDAAGLWRDAADGAELLRTAQRPARVRHAEGADLRGAAGQAARRAARRAGGRRPARTARTARPARSPTSSTGLTGACPRVQAGGQGGRRKAQAAH